MTNYPKIKQGFIVDSGGEIIDSHHLAQGLMKKENHIFYINIEPRCKCGLHNAYQDWIHKCEEEIKENERKKQEERELQQKIQQEQIKQQRDAEKQAQMALKKQNQSSSKLWVENDETSLRQGEHSKDANEDGTKQRDERIGATPSFNMVRQGSLFQSGPALPTFRDIKDDEETRIDFDVSQTEIQDIGKIDWLHIDPNNFELLYQLGRQDEATILDLLSLPK